MKKGAADWGGSHSPAPSLRDADGWGLPSAISRRSDRVCKGRIWTFKALWRNLDRKLVASGTVQLDGKILVTIDAPLIMHGEAAVQPAVLGLERLAYLSQIVLMFNTHVHPGELAA